MRLVKVKDEDRRTLSPDSLPLSCYETSSLWFEYATQRGGAYPFTEYEIARRS